MDELKYKINRIYPSNWDKVSGGLGAFFCLMGLLTGNMPAALGWGLCTYWHYKFMRNRNGA